MEKEEFERIVIEAIETVPEKFKKKFKNISIVIEDKSMSHLPDNDKSPGQKVTLGLYQGLPLTRRAGRRSLFPDKITIYKKSLETISKNEKDLKKNIKRVVLHELGHYFGLDEKKLRSLGY